MLCALARSGEGALTLFLPLLAVVLLVVLMLALARAAAIGDDLWRQACERDDFWGDDEPSWDWPELR